MIKTFVFLDIETTDLIRGIKLPKITEIAMVAVTRGHLQIPKTKLPRVLWKLVIPINPIADIPKIVTKLTHLTNQHLQNIKPFDSDIFCSMLHSLNRMEKPICFVAHNGKKFDFPILLNEFRNLGQEMPGEILAIDSIDAFKNYFEENPCAQEKELKHEEKNVESCHSLLKDSWDDAFCAVLDSVEKFESFEEITELERRESFDKEKEISMHLQRTNDKTPELQLMKEAPVKNLLPPKFVNKEPVFKKPESFKLGTIFKNMTGSSAEIEHYAESDCLNLIRCANLIGDDFIEFADNHAKPLLEYERRIQS